MKKLLSFISAIGVVSTASTSVISCGTTKNDKPNPSPDPVEKKFTMEQVICGKTPPCDDPRTYTEYKKKKISGQEFSINFRLYMEDKNQSWYSQFLEFMGERVLSDEKDGSETSTYKATHSFESALDDNSDKYDDNQTFYDAKDRTISRTVVITSSSKEYKGEDKKIIIQSSYIVSGEYKITMIEGTPFN